MAKFIEVHKGDAPYLLNLDDISSITAFGGETCFWHRDGDSSIYDENFDTVRLMIGAAQGGIPMDTGGNPVLADRQSVAGSKRRSRSRCGAGEYGEACRRYPYCHCGAKMQGAENE